MSKNSNIDQLPFNPTNIDVIFVSHSGGKDSQAMLARLISLGLKDKIVLIHADLGEMEWEPMHHWIEENSFGLPCHVVRAPIDFFELCRSTGRLPSGLHQYCTDHLKTEPIKVFIHDYMTRHNFTTAINATGIRADESERRKYKSAYVLSQGPKTSGMHMPVKYPGHVIYDWLPLFRHSTSDVWAEIRRAGQTPHKIYSMGFSRLSCVFCINGRIEEHKEASRLRPELALKIANLERELGKSYRLKQVKGVRMQKYFDEYLPDMPPAIPVC